MNHINSQQESARRENPRLRINGVVRVADRLRRELAQPISGAHRQQLERIRTQSLLQIEQILREHGAGPESLPAPSRRAYEFLRALNFDAIVAGANSGSATEPAPIISVFLSGLTAFFDNVVRRLATAADAAGADESFQSIRSDSVNIERHLKDDGLNGSSLSAQSRSIRG